MRYFKLFSCFIALSIIMAGPVQAGQECYSNFEFEAEQGLRIHSELMVIGLTCQKAPGGSGLYNKYRIFTKRNGAMLQQYENAMLSYFRQNGMDPEKALHYLRTGLANEISRKAVSMNVAAFCSRYGGRIDRALAMDHDTLRRWAQKQWPSQPPTQPLCRSGYSPH